MDHSWPWSWKKKKTFSTLLKTTENNSKPTQNPHNTFQPLSSFFFCCRFSQERKRRHAGSLFFKPFTFFFCPLRQTMAAFYLLFAPSAFPEGPGLWPLKSGSEATLLGVCRAQRWGVTRCAAYSPPQSSTDRQTDRHIDTDRQACVCMSVWRSVCMLYVCT